MRRDMIIYLCRWGWCSRCDVL